MTTIPCFRACSQATVTFGEVPEVEIARQTSPLVPSASICLAKTFSNPVSFATQVGKHATIGGQRDSRQAATLLQKAVNQLAGDVLRVGGRAAVAENQKLAFGFEGGSNYFRRAKNIRPVLAEKAPLHLKAVGDDG